MRSVDVISVTYGSGAEIEECLRSVRPAANLSQIVVVDNASADDSVSAAERGGADCVVRNRVNVGFAAAVNIGLARTDADLVLLLNPDARIRPEALARLCLDFDEEPAAAVVAPLLRAENGALSAGAGRTATPARRVGLCLPGVGRLPALRPEYALPRDPRVARRPVDVGYVYGAAMLVDRSFLLACGGLDERYLLFAEDEDICRQARRAGRRVLLDGRAEATHVGGASCSDQPSIEAQRLFSTWRLFEKWGGRGHAAAYHRGILAAFRARELAATLERGPRPPITRTARLFDEAVRSGVDPLVRSGDASPEVVVGACAISDARPAPELRAGSRCGLGEDSGCSTGRAP